MTSQENVEELFSLVRKLPVTICHIELICQLWVFCKNPVLSPHLIYIESYMYWDEDPIILLVEC